MCSLWVFHIEAAFECIVNFSLTIVITHARWSGAMREKRPCWSALNHDRAGRRKQQQIKKINKTKGKRSTHTRGSVQVRDWLLLAWKTQPTCAKPRGKGERKQLVMSDAFDELSKSGQMMLKQICGGAFDRHESGNLVNWKSASFISHQLRLQCILGAYIVLLPHYIYVLNLITSWQIRSRIRMKFNLFFSVY